MITLFHLQTINLKQQHAFLFAFKVLATTVVEPSDKIIKHTHKKYIIWLLLLDEPEENKPSSPLFLFV